MYQSIWLSIRLFISAVNVFIDHVLLMVFLHFFPLLFVALLSVAEGADGNFHPSGKMKIDLLICSSEGFRR